MDEWFEATRQQLEAIAHTIEQQVDSTINSVLDASDRLAEDIDQAIAPALDNLDKWEAEVSQQLAQQMSAWLPEVPPEAIQEVERRVDEWVDSTGGAIGEALRPVEQTVKPLINEHSTCVACRHYHGEAYGEDSNMLICGMHPFGVDAEQCPDWESTWQDAERSS